MTVSGDFPDIPSSDVPDSVAVFHASPLHYLVDSFGTDPREFDTMNHFEFGPATLADVLFICPDCEERDAPGLHAEIEGDGSGHATVSCQNCDWDNRQELDGGDE